MCTLYPALILRSDFRLRTFSERIEALQPDSSAQTNASVVVPRKKTGDGSSYAWCLYASDAAFFTGDVREFLRAGEFMNGKVRKDIRIGAAVAIVLKKDQPTGAADRRLRGAGSGNVSG